MWQRASVKTTNWLLFHFRCQNFILYGLSELLASLNFSSLQVCICQSCVRFMISQVAAHLLQYLPALVPICIIYDNVAVTSRVHPITSIETSKLIYQLLLTSACLTGPDSCEHIMWRRAFCSFHRQGQGILVGMGALRQLGLGWQVRQARSAPLHICS